MANVIVVLIILAIVGASTAKIIIEKKKGVKCIGCPHSGKSNCGCNSQK